MKVATYGRTDGRYERDGRSVPYGTVRAERARSYGKEKAEVVAAVARALNGISAAPMPPRLKDIFVSQVGHLLKGGYDLALIRNVAVNLAHQDVQKLANIGASVRVEQSKLDEEEHKARKREELEPWTSEAQAAAAAYLGQVKTERTHPTWGRICEYTGCSANALYGREFCKAHEEAA